VNEATDPRTNTGLVAALVAVAPATNKEAVRRTTLVNILAWNHVNDWIVSYVA
jgi:hypothetical protein